jgi:hypothetical protein
MGYFLESEKQKQVQFKLNSSYFLLGAKGDGVYKGLARPFCLPLDRANENLYPGIRSSIKTYFEKHEIKWHDGQNHNPSNHLCDSQVCCANFLFPFADKPEALASLLRPLFPTLNRMLPIEDMQYVAFEWIGEKNYLGEKISRNRKRTRGANFTSADAAVLFELQDGHRQACLIEWKYTEAYYRTWLKFAASGTDRTEIYRHLYEADDCPLDKTILTDMDWLFYEPFYQFMRQQFLAHEMEKAHELESDIVSLLHISPAHNSDFGTVTSPELKTIEITATRVWKKLVRHPGRFIGEYTENIFGNFEIQHYPELKEWWKYITGRYAWVIE